MDNKFHELSSKVYYLQEKYKKLLDKINQMKEEGDKLEDEFLRCKAELKAHEDQQHKKFFGDEPRTICQRDNSSTPIKE